MEAANMRPMWTYVRDFSWKWSFVCARDCAQELRCFMRQNLMPKVAVLWTIAHEISSFFTPTSVRDSWVRANNDGEERDSGGSKEKGIF